MAEIISKGIPPFFWYVIAICVLMLSTTVCFVAYKASSIKLEYEGKIIEFERERLASDLKEVQDIAEKIVPSSNAAVNATAEIPTNNFVYFNEDFSTIGLYPSAPESTIPESYPDEATATAPIPEASPEPTGGSAESSGQAFLQEPITSDADIQRLKQSIERVKQRNSIAQESLKRSKE